MTVRLHINLDPDYRIVENGLGYELQYMDPVMHEWHTLFEAPTIVLCEKAYTLHQEGWSVLPDWEELEEKQTA